MGNNASTKCADKAAPGNKIPDNGIFEERPLLYESICQSEPEADFPSTMTCDY